MAILLEPRQAPVAASSPVTGAPSLISATPFVQPTVFSAASTTSNSVHKTIAPGILAAAIIVPLIVILGLAFLFAYFRRRSRAAESDNTRDLSSSSTPPNTAVTATSNGSANTNITSESRREIRRARRLRRTDSGGTVKTLPEYNELGEDEILLSKAIETPTRHGSRGRAVSSHPREESSESVSRRSSLTAVLRRLSLRRSEPEPPTEDESNEMEDMIERATLHSVVEDANEQRMSPVREEQNLPIDDTPDYDQLYPTLPPQIQIHQDNGDVEVQATSSSDTRRARGLRNMFRRQAASTDTTSQRNTSAGELGLSMTESNDLSLYRPSTSSSRSMIFGGSSISLLSQAGNESNDTLGRSTLPRRQHIRNISAPISTRRLQLAPPVAGFSDQQMHFLTSVESLDRYGVPVEGAVGGEDQQLPPPSFEELAREEERLEQQPSRHLAPILTSAELIARQERSPLSPPPLPSIRSPVAAQADTPSAQHNGL